MKKKPDTKLRMSATRLGLAGLGLFLTTGCMSLESEEGRLPAAMRTAINTFSAKGYPDLTKIPDPPKDVPTQATWSSLENGLVTQGKALTDNPESRAPASEETNLTWADAARRSINEDPRAEPVTPVPVDGSQEADWAKAARAKLDADIARLPPT